MLESSLQTNDCSVSKNFEHLRLTR